MNYNDSYLNWNGSAPFPVVRDANFSPVGGGQVVADYMTVDLHVGYTFGRSGPFEGMQVYLDASNLLDEDPPFVNAIIGFDCALSCAS